MQEIEHAFSSVHPAVVEEARRLVVAARGSWQEPCGVDRARNYRASLRVNGHSFSYVASVRNRPIADIRMRDTNRTGAACLS